MPRPQSSIYGNGNASLHSRETHPCSRPIASCSVSSHVLPFKAAATSSISRRPSLAEKLGGLRPRRLASCWRDTGASPDRPAEPLPSAVQPEEGAGAKRGKEAWPRSACGWLCSSEIGHRMRTGAQKTLGQGCLLAYRQLAVRSCRGRLEFRHTAGTLVWGEPLG